jgi:hypothetical protein
MKKIISEFLTAAEIDSLMNEKEDFNLVTKSEVRRIGGFNKSYKGKFDEWNDYFFYKAKGMTRGNLYGNK